MKTATLPPTSSFRCSAGRASGVTIGSTKTRKKIGIDFPGGTEAPGLEHGSHVRLSNLTAGAAKGVGGGGGRRRGENCERGENPNKKDDGGIDRSRDRHRSEFETGKEGE
ncbi:hypothetical protein KM043_010993 [Ampulex compressa]|nr:hypothetical protein KM043_010993 [Ampulex compressa]